jgi:hypothetical protein
MDEMLSGVPSVRVDRVVAVAATLFNGREQLGSGYLVSGRQVLTAEHCTRDKVTGEPAARLRVIRASDGAVADVADVVPDRGLDVAVLRLANDAPWDAHLPSPAFARVDQSHSGILEDCTGIGFPLFQRDPDRRTRHSSEFHGRIYQTDERESGHLLMREPLIHPGPVADPKDEAQSDPGGKGPSPWGGLSGALMFYRGHAIGVVVEHHLRQGDNALRAIGFERIAAASVKIRQCLGLPEPHDLPYLSEQAPARPVMAGRPLAEVADPFALEVHRPIRPDDSHPDLPVLPTYMPRDHDAKLGSVVRAAAEGSSSIAVLVGGSSTGKTRACWEALQLLRDRPEPWRLWHPIDPTRPDAALRELSVIGPRTVVWLNEAQLYLDTADGLGERVAAGLRELLRDPARAPVLVLATLWPQFWDALTIRPPGAADPHAQARELLTGHDTTVPAVFTAAQLRQISQVRDPRLALAAAAALDGQVIQFLAGAPELLSRYRNAPPAAAALIHAAMDARRLGMGVGLPYAFLEAAVAGYLSETEWAALDEGWLEQALAYTAMPCKGVHGPLTSIRPRPAASTALVPSSRDAGKQLAGTRIGITGEPLYRLADYLDQYGRHHRKGQFPPSSFWTAAADHARPGDQAELADAARARGLYRDAARLLKKAAAHARLDDIDDAYAVATLLDSLREAGAQEQIPELADRAAAQLRLDDPDAVATLLDSLRETGAKRQAAVLLRRNPAARVRLDDPFAVARLLDSLRKRTAKRQVAVLLRRDPAAHVRLDDPRNVAWLLLSLWQAGGNEQVAVLLRRDPAAHVRLDILRDVAWLLMHLRWFGANEQATALLRRAAAQVRLDDPNAVATLLDSLRETGCQKQAAALIGRALDHVRLDDPFAVHTLLDSLREAGGNEQVAVLLRRDPAAHVQLDGPFAVACLLDSLRKAGANDQVAALLRRDPAAQVRLDSPYTLARLLDSLREAGAQEQAAALLRRDPAAHVQLDKPDAVATLLDSLRKAGAQEQAAALAGRLPGEGKFELFLKQEDHQDRYRFGREADGSPAKPWDWRELD